MLFLYQRTVANRLRQQMARAKSPRYLAAVVMGMLYIWWALFRNSRLGGGPLASIVKTDVAVPIASAFMLLYGVVWVSLIWMYWTEVRKTEMMGKNAPASPLSRSFAR